MAKMKSRVDKHKQLFKNEKEEMNKVESFRY